MTTRRSSGRCSKEVHRLASETAVIVQARFGSSRLPGKVLEPFGASTLLGHVFDRLRRSIAGHGVWLATTATDADDPVARVGADAGVGVFRGSEQDVLGRFAACVEAMPSRPRLVVRVCADRPLVCPVLLDELLDVYERVGRPDYLSNTSPKTFPDGLDLELVRTDALLEAATAADDPYEREHVTPFLYRRADRYRVVNITCAYGNFAGVRATIDTGHDYERLRNVEARLCAASPRYEYRDVLNLATLDPGAFP